MIGKLKGRMDSRDGDSVIVDVGGVGYLVFCPARTALELHEGDAVELIIETHVREDHIHLFGFATSTERDWFRLLGTVQGVGAKMAMALLSAFSPEQLNTIIASKDVKALTAAQGVGKKLGERVVNELKNKVTGVTPGENVIPLPTGTATPTGNKEIDDALSALVNLGYNRSDAYTAISRAQSQLKDGAKLDDMIRTALKELAS